MPFCRVARVASGGRTRTILYVGAFVLPDKNAAAHRILANAKILRDLGYEIVCVSTAPPPSDDDADRPVDIEGFQSWAVGSGSKYGSAYQAKALLARAREIPDLAGVILYNMPVLPALRLLREAHRRGAFVVGDIADWYEPEGGPLRRFGKSADTFARMHLLNRRMDGLIVISNFLASFYRSRRPILVLPPLVDLQDRKWESTPVPDDDALHLAYAGSPSRRKERLDLALQAIQELSPNLPITLDIVGITAAQYRVMYPDSAESGNDQHHVRFFGRVEHQVALDIVKRADATLLVRDSTRLTRAGFPTKFVESISCGVPVIATDSSDLADYLDDGSAGSLVAIDGLADAIAALAERKKLGRLPQTRRDQFDYHRFLAPVAAFLTQVAE